MYASPQRSLLPFLTVLLLGYGVDLWGEDQPLHQRIDRILADASLGRGGPIASDSKYLRRIYLDLIGTVPSADEVRGFLQDTSPDKRVRLVDRLLQDERHAEHLANVLDVFLMERRSGPHVTEEDWQEYLRESVVANKPWNQLAREILASDGTHERIREAAKFYLDRNGDPDLITRDVGRVFFGMDLQCCQCHDHPLVDSFLQSDYFGIYAFLSRGFLFTDPAKKVFYAEKAEGDVEFTSVFTQDKSSTLPKLPGEFQITEPPVMSGSEYLIKPAKGIRPIPKYSRRARLAELTTASTNSAFNRNIVNRLWELMMGRGLVHPVDLHHADNEPAHPLLLDVLATDFAASGYDIRRFIRELALTRAYQRASIGLPAVTASRQTLTQSLELATRSVARAKAEVKQRREVVEAADAEFAQLQEELAARREAFKQANTAIAKALKKNQKASQKLSEAKDKMAKKRTVAVAVREAAEKSAIAADRLGDDEELNNAAQQFATRADKLEKELSAIAKSVTKLNTEAESDAKSLSLARSAADPIAQRLRGLQARYEAAARPLRESAARLRAAEIQWKSALSRKAVFEQWASQQAAAFRLDESRRAFELATARRNEQLKQLQETRLQLSELELQTTGGADTQGQVRQELAQTQQELATQRELADAVIQAAETAKAAVAHLSKGDALRKTAASLASRSAQARSGLKELDARVQALTQTVADVEKRAGEAREALVSARETISQSEVEITALEQRLPTLQSEVDAASTAHARELESSAELSDQLFFSGRLKPLSPEQLARAVMQVTGFLDRQRRSAEATADRSLPPSPMLLEDRRQFIEEFVKRKTRGHLAAFVKLFGHAKGQPQSDFFSSVDQALYFANSGTMQSWLNPGGGNLSERLVRMESPAQVAEELYLSILSRHPAEEERELVAQHLADRVEDDRRAAIKQMIWALITSVEFRFNH